MWFPPNFGDNFTLINGDSPLLASPTLGSGGGMVRFSYYINPNLSYFPFHWSGLQVLSSLV